MSWRTVVITNKTKLSYKNDYMIIRSKEINMVHLSEINTIIVDSTAVTLTSYLIAELLNRKIKVIFCDNTRNPLGEIVPYYGCYDCSKKLFLQLNWSDYSKVVWTRIIKEKILNQADLLKRCDNDNYHKLYTYAQDLELFDITNREGHAAKVYFNSLFGMDFSREDNNEINAALNYGYAILLSQFNKEIVSNGYNTQIGIKHHNMYNQFNLSSDLMEPFRPLVDNIVKQNHGEVFNSTMKLKLVDVLNHKVHIKSRDQYVSNAIGIYLKSVFKAIEKEDVSFIEFFEYEL